MSRSIHLFSRSTRVAPIRLSDTHTLACNTGRQGPNWKFHPRGSTGCRSARMGVGRAPPGRAVTKVRRHFRRGNSRRPGLPCRCSASLFRCGMARVRPRHLSSASRDRCGPTVEGYPVRRKPRGSSPWLVHVTAFFARAGRRCRVIDTLNRDTPVVRGPGRIISSAHSQFTTRPQEGEQ